MQATATAAPAELDRSPVDGLPLAKLSRSAAAAALEAARTALHQGKQATFQAQQHLASYDDLDERISKASAEQIRSAGARPIPAKLEQEYNERRTARERLGITGAGLTVLQRELAQAEQALREADAALTVQAIDLMLTEGGAIAEQIGAHYRQISQLEDRVHGLEFMLSELARPLPPDVRVRLAAQLRKLKEALIPPKRPYVAGLQAEYAARVKAPWLERFNELTK